MADIHETEWRGSVDWADIDAMGHVNNLAILRYIQSARVVMCASLGVMREAVSPKIGPIVAHIDIQFRAPLKYPAEVCVLTRLVGRGRTSFELEHTVVDGEGRIVADEREVMVYYDYVRAVKASLPDNFPPVSAAGLIKK